MLWLVEQKDIRIEDTELHASTNIGKTFTYVSSIYSAS